MSNKPSAVVNVHENVDKCRHDLHIPKESRQHYLLTCKKSVPAVDITTDRQQLDCTVQGQLGISFSNFDLIFI